MSDKILELNLVGREEALEILNVTDDDFTELISSGFIYPFYSSGKQLFPVEELYLLKHRIATYKTRDIDVLQLVQRIEFLEKQLYEVMGQMELLLGYFGLSTKQLGGAALDNLQYILEDLSKQAYAKVTNYDTLDYLLDVLLSFNNAHIKIIKTILNIDDPISYVTELLQTIRNRTRRKIEYRTKIDLVLRHFSTLLLPKEDDRNEMVSKKVQSKK